LAGFETRTILKAPSQTRWEKGLFPLPFASNFLFPLDKSPITNYAL
jgi:hypothetical protein